MHRIITAQELEYLKWQGCACDWYLASRLLLLESNLTVASYATQHTMELLLKATLVYLDKAFLPKAYGHKFSGLLRRIEEIIGSARTPDIPPYLLRYQVESRYPGDSLGFPDASVSLSDLDRCFCSLLELVPFQFNTRLGRIFTGVDKKEWEILARDNAQAANLRHILQPWLGKAPGGLAPFPDGF
jgi:HEPN domain-containing protein